MKMCFAYYEHLRHLRQLLTEEISSKQTQQKINYFFKQMNVSSQLRRTQMATCYELWK
jgi:hypothetical protein